MLSNTRKRFPEDNRNGGECLPEGLILKGVGGFYLVETGTGLYECRTRGIYRKKGITPLPGDSVSFTITDKERHEGWIEEIHQRRNSFVRPPVANVSRLAVVMAPASPEPDFDLVDKLLVTARINDIEPFIIVNKTDLAAEALLDEMKSIYRATGYPVISMFKISMEGYDILHEELKGFNTVFAGQSGVGKSTILNNVINSWVMETGDVSSKIQRGRHTTRHVQLLPLDCGGYVADTPGFSSFMLEGISHDELQWMYPEFGKYLGRCRFKGCSHVNEPGCAVKDAVESNEIPSQRYKCYKKLFEELKALYEKRYR